MGRECTVAQTMFSITSGFIVRNKYKVPVGNGWNVRCVVIAFDVAS